MYLKDNNPDAAAQSFIMDGDYENAAKIYGQSGKKLDKPLRWKRQGRRLAASGHTVRTRNTNAHLSFLRKRSMTKRGCKNVWTLSHWKGNRFN